MSEVNKVLGDPRAMRHLEKALRHALKGGRRDTDKTMDRSLVRVENVYGPEATFRAYTEFSKPFTSEIE